MSYGVMDKVMARKGDHVVKGTVMYSDTVVFDYEKEVDHKKGFYLNPMFGANIYLDYDADEVTIIGKFNKETGEQCCPTCGYKLEWGEFECQVDPLHSGGGAS